MPPQAWTETSVNFNSTLSLWQVENQKLHFIIHVALLEKGEGSPCSPGEDRGLIAQLSEARSPGASRRAKTEFNYEATLLSSWSLDEPINLPRKPVPLALVIFT